MKLEVILSKRIIDSVIMTDALWRMRKWLTYGIKVTADPMTRDQSPSQVQLSTNNRYSDYVDHVINILPQYKLQDNKPTWNTKHKLQPNLFKLIP